MPLLRAWYQTITCRFIFLPPPISVFVTEMNIDATLEGCKAKGATACHLSICCISWHHRLHSCSTLLVAFSVSRISQLVSDLAFFCCYICPVFLSQLLPAGPHLRLHVGLAVDLERVSYVQKGIRAMLLPGCGDTFTPPPKQCFAEILLQSHIYRYGTIFSI